MHRHPGFLRDHPLLFIGVLRALEPDATLEEFSAAAEAVLGRSLLDPVDPAEDTEAPEELQAEIHAALRDPGALNLKEAADLVKRNQTTVARWCKQHGIGRKIGGRWQVSRSELRDLVRTR